MKLFNLDYIYGNFEIGYALEHSQGNIATKINNILLNF